MKPACHPCFAHNPWLLRAWIAATGRIGYAGTRLYLPGRSGLIPVLVSGRGIYEPEVAGLITELLRQRPGAVFDVGGNVGLHSVWALNQSPASTVRTFEPSPAILPYLNRTHAESSYRPRWTIMPHGLSNRAGSFSFYSSGADDSPYDGLRPTHRVGGQQACEQQVPVNTLDAEWHDAGRPAVTLIKIDTEGGECDVLEGAGECLAACRPAIIIEWNRVNLAAYGKTAADAFALAVRHAYDVLTIPAYVPITGAAHLALDMTRNENFLLLPKERGHAATA